MKTKKTVSLRKQIMWYFILCSFGVAVVESAVDSTFDDVLVPVLYQVDGGQNMIDLPHLIYLGISLGLFVVGALVFYRLTAKALKEESERRVKAQNLLYAAIAHDLKTPMTSVMGFAKALSDGRIPAEEQQETFDLICRKAGSMNDMVNTLFDYAKLGTEGYVPHIEPLDACVLVRDIVAEHYCELEEHVIELELDIPDMSVMIHGDRTELRRAISNLIVNVYKHNPDGIKAKVSVSSEQGKAVICVADSGSCLPDDTDIFEPFVTENTARTVGQGTGLGLAITKRIIEYHKGSITLQPCNDGYTKKFVMKI